MTDFGRRAGTGDMLKSVYDTNDDGYVDGLKDHKELHQQGGDEEIALTGLVGATPRAILGDATAGRVLRGILLYIQNGSNPNTLKCEVFSRWNGDVIAIQDNIAKDATTGHFKLNAAGTLLTILNAGLTGDALYAISNPYANSSTTELLTFVIRATDGITYQAQGLSDGTAKDLTSVIEGGSFGVHILYITTA